MKIQFLLSFLVIAIIFVTTNAWAFAQTSSSSAQVQTVNLDQKVNDLKEKIASRVAELKLVEKRGIVGTVTNTSSTQITLSDINGNIRFVDVDELTKFSSPSARTSFGISDITRGATVGVLGLYNKSSRRILARFVDVKNQMQFVHGVVSSIDSTNFRITIATNDNKQLNVDVGTTTKTISYTKADGAVKSGFSKITSGENVMVIGFSDTKDKNIIIASRIILLPQISKNPKINTFVPGSSQQEPSTGSGKVLTPKTY